jgi:hypothetical protein
MLGIRRNPFDDATEFMIATVDREAAAEGVPLTEQEKTLLRKQEPAEFPVGSRERVRQLVRRILDREANSGRDTQAKSFMAALKWAGDGAYPYIVQITEEVFGHQVNPFRPLQGWDRVKDKLFLIVAGFVVVGIMFAFVAVLSLLRIL